jgi:hypothetical protein
MKILITASNEFIGAALEVGKWYQVELAESGTDRQNRAFHALVQEYWRSGCHSYNARSFEHFRALIKLYLGAGAEPCYSVIDEHGRARAEPIRSYRLKSWSAYTKKERGETIDRLISEMHQAGVQTRQFYEILAGMERPKQEA